MPRAGKGALRDLLRREFAPICYDTSETDAGNAAQDGELISERMASLKYAGEKQSGDGSYDGLGNGLSNGLGNGSGNGLSNGLGNGSGNGLGNNWGKQSSACAVAECGSIMRAADVREGMSVVPHDTQAFRAVSGQNVEIYASGYSPNKARGMQNASGTRAAKASAPPCRAARFGLVSVHPALIGLAVLTLLLGQGRLLAMTMAVMAVHEMAHILCARAVGVPIGRLRITPLGAALELDARLLSPRQEVLIAGAGPLASALTVAVLCLMTGRGLDDALLRESAGIALAITLFNMLPASPLDGGRVLHALLRARLGERRACDVCGALGMLMALWLMSCVLVSAARGVVPVMLMAAAFSVYALAAGEFMGDAQTAWQLAWSHRDELERGECLPVRVVAVDASTPARSLLGGLRRGSTTVFRVMDARMRCIGELSEAELISRCVDSPEADARTLLAMANVR